MPRIKIWSVPKKELGNILKKSEIIFIHKDIFIPLPLHGFVATKIKDSCETAVEPLWLTLLNIMAQGLPLHCVGILYCLKNTDL